MLELILPAVVGGLFSLAKGDPDIPEPPKPRKPRPQFIPSQAMAAPTVDPGSSVSMMASTPQTQLAALSMFDLDRDKNNPFEKGMFS